MHPVPAVQAHGRVLAAPWGAPMWCGCGVQEVGFRELRFTGLGFGVWGLRFGVRGLGFRVHGLGFRVLGFGVWGVRFRV